VEHVACRGRVGLGAGDVGAEGERAEVGGRGGVGAEGEEERVVARRIGWLEEVVRRDQSRRDGEEGEEPAPSGCAAAVAGGGRGRLEERLPLFDGARRGHGCGGHGARPLEVEIGQ